MPNTHYTQLYTHTHGTVCTRPVTDTHTDQTTSPYTHTQSQGHKRRSFTHFTAPHTAPHKHPPHYHQGHSLRAPDTLKSYIKKSHHTQWGSQTGHRVTPPITRHSMTAIHINSLSSTQTLIGETMSSTAQPHGHTRAHTWTMTRICTPSHTRKAHEHSHTQKHKWAPTHHHKEHTMAVICTQPYRHTHRERSHNNTATHPQSDTHDDSHTMTATGESHIHHTDHTGIPKAAPLQLYNHTLTQNDNHTITTTLTTAAWLLGPGVPSPRSPPRAGFSSPSSRPPLPLPAPDPQGTRPAGAEPWRDTQTEGR